MNNSNPFVTMKKTGISVRLRLCAAAGILLGAQIFTLPLHAAEPAPANTIDMSVQVGQALSGALDLMSAGKLDEAAAALQQLRQSPLNDYELSRVLQQSVNLAITQARHQDAVNDSEALLETSSLSDSERTSATLMLGKLYLQLENWSKGVEALLQANERQPGNTETLYLLGFGHYRLQQPAMAIQWLEQAVAVNAAQAGEPVYSLLGVLYVDTKDYAKAVTTYETLVNSTPAPVQAESYHSTLAQLYVQTGNNGKARSTLQLLIDNYPASGRSADYRQRLAALK